MRKNISSIRTKQMLSDVLAELLSKKALIKSLYRTLLTNVILTVKLFIIISMTSTSLLNGCFIKRLPALSDVI